MKLTADLKYCFIMAVYISCPCAFMCVRTSTCVSLDVCLSCVHQTLVTLANQCVYSEEGLPMDQYLQQSVETTRGAGRFAVSHLHLD